jgi:hypothetical protein
MQTKVNLGLGNEEVNLLSKKQLKNLNRAMQLCSKAQGLILDVQVELDDKFGYEKSKKIQRLLGGVLLFGALESTIEVLYMFETGALNLDEMLQKNAVVRKSFEKVHIIM